MSLYFRQNNLTRPFSESDIRLTFAAGYTVTVYEPGGQVEDAVNGSGGSTVTNMPGHAFEVGDKSMLYNDAGTICAVTNVDGDEVTFGANLSLAVGDYMVNLGNETGHSTPNYDGSDVLIYSDPGATVLLEDSQLLVDDQGNYQFYSRDQTFTELVRDTNGDPIAVIIATGTPIAGPPYEFLATNFGAIGDGSTDNAAAFARMVSAVNNVPIIDGLDAVWVKVPYGRYVYSDGLAFTRPVVFEMEPGCVMSYTGTGKALQMGPEGLTDVTYVNHLEYTVKGGTFIGGATMTHGIYFPNHIVRPRLCGVGFRNFGNAAAYAMWFDGDNWDIVIDGQCRALDTNVENTLNLIRVNGDGDNGQSVLNILPGAAFNHINNVNCGIGIYVNGLHSKIDGVSIGGYNPEILLGPIASFARILNCHFETQDPDSVASIQYGDEPGGDDEGNDLQGLVIENCFANCRGDLGSAVFLAPRSTATGLAWCRVDNNFVANLDSATTPFITLNNSASQINNTAEGNRISVQGSGTVMVRPVVHTAGSNIQDWATDDIEILEPKSVALTGSTEIDTNNTSLIYLTNTSGVNTPTLSTPERDGRLLEIRIVAITANSVTIATGGTARLASDWTTPGVRDALILRSRAGLWEEVARVNVA